MDFWIFIPKRKCIHRYSNELCWFMAMWSYGCVFLKRGMSPISGNFTHDMCSIYPRDTCDTLNLWTYRWPSSIQWANRPKIHPHGYLNGENDGSPWWFFWVPIFRQMNLRHSHLIVRTNNAVRIPDAFTSYCVNHEKFAIVAILLFLHVLVRLHCRDISRLHGYDVLHHLTSFII